MEISEYEKNKNNRDWNIKRLEKSMNKWRIGGLDKILPEEYIKYMNILQGLKDGLDFTIKKIPHEKLFVQCAEGITGNQTLTNGKKLSDTKIINNNGAIHGIIQSCLY